MADGLILQHPLFTGRQYSFRKVSIGFDETEKREMGISGSHFLKHFIKCLLLLFFSPSVVPDSLGPQRL